MYITRNDTEHICFLGTTFSKIKECTVSQVLFVTHWLQLRDINARLERIEPKIHSSDAAVSNYPSTETKPTILASKKSSPKAKNTSRENSLFGG